MHHKSIIYNKPTRCNSGSIVFIKNTIPPESHLVGLLYISPVCVEVPQFMGILNTCIISTHYVAQSWEQVPPEFGITLIVMEQVEIFEFLCRATAHTYGASYNTATDTTFQLVGLVTAVMYQVTGLTCSFVYDMGLQHAGVIHNLAGSAHLVYWRATREPAHNNGVYLCHKRLDAHGSLNHVSRDIGHCTSS